MQKIDFYTASRVIFDSINVEQDKKILKQDLDLLLRNDSGRDVQSILVKAGIGLDRADMTSGIISYLNRTIYEFNFNGFKSISTDGNYKDAETVLYDRIYGDDGVVNLFKYELENIFANTKHISSDETIDVDEFWRQSISKFKKKLFNELDAYIILANTIAERAVDNFNTANSNIMNFLLQNKKEAENQQTVLIKLNTSDEPITLKESSIVNSELLLDFLIEASAGANFIIFAKRLNAIIERTAPLTLFAGPYRDLSKVSGSHWIKLQSVKHSLNTEGEKAAKVCKYTITTQLESIDYNQLDYIFELDVYVKDIVDLFISKIDILINDSNEWITSVGDSGHYINAISDSTK